jgi:hypothetical protein
MTVNKLITQINIDTNEILDDSSEYIPYINASIDILASLLIPMHDTEVVKEKTIRDNDVVPTEFMTFVPGSGYPVEIYNGVFKTYDGHDVKHVYYAVRKAHIASMDDAVPFADYYVFPLIQIVSYLVKKKSLMIDFANADSAFVQQITQIIKDAKAR